MKEFLKLSVFANSVSSFWACWSRSVIDLLHSASSRHIQQSVTDISAKFAFRCLYTTWRYKRERKTTQFSLNVHVFKTTWRW